MVESSAKLVRIVEALEAEMYSAYPCLTRAWAEGNTYELLRQFIQKGTDLRTVSEEDIRRYKNTPGSMQRKCLGFRLPSVVFAELRRAA